MRAGTPKKSPKVQGRRRTYGWLLLLMLCFCAVGCASFPGESLPSYTYSDLAAPPEEKVCLVVPDELASKEKELFDETMAMFEKSGYFLKAPEHCSPSGEKIENHLSLKFENDTKYDAEPLSGKRGS